MSENKHTPEPWEYWENDRTGFGVKMPRKKKTRFGAEPYAVIGGFEQEDRAEMKANARRIVACVNACEGIPTYQLTGEDGNPVILGDMIDLLRNQRDKLLPICKELRESAEYWSEYDVPLGIVGRLKAAIASVKGGVV